MRGDLHTLKEVCRYGSSVMLAGEAVIGVVIAALVVLGVLSPFSDGAVDVLKGFLDADLGDAAAFSATYLAVLAIFVLGFLTVRTVHDVMVSIHSEHSPFTEGNTVVVMRLSKIYMVGAVLLAVLEAVSSSDPAHATFMLFGCILVSVVLYIFALMIRYGSVLQNEWDHTL